MPSAERKILVTSALPYANGPIHIGHLVEYIQTDIWVRYQRCRGHDCVYVCADDGHGTPIMLKALEEEIAAEELIEQVGREHRADFSDFAISFDNYHTTHSEENRHYSNLIYERLRDGGHIATRTIRQAFDPEKQMFLPDRFIRGTCPKCRAPEQYGDNCEVCGSTYSPSDLIDPVSVLSGATPVQRDSEHLFVKLGDFESFLSEWVAGRAPGQNGRAPVQPGIANKLDEWFAAGLQDWDISRDAPYFGFEIPDKPGKYFYVWLDAPIGYMASFRNYCDRVGLEFDAYWNRDSNAEVYHFIGKDIAYFHTLFWPAMLHGAGFRTPTAVYCHGFLTVDGQKMSKRRGTFIKARTYLNHLNPEYLRYYFACKLGSGIDDLDLSMDDFVQRVNADLVGKVVNIASRCARFINKQFDGYLSHTIADDQLFSDFSAPADSIGGAYEDREFGKAMREIMALADRANQYIDERKPWVMAKSRDKADEVQAVCTMGLNLFRLLMIYLAPVLPRTAEKAAAFLCCERFTWEDSRSPILALRINDYEPLLTRVDRNKVTQMIEESREAPDEPNPGGSAAEPVAPEITIDEFNRIDLRVARIEAASEVD
ncbi:MAG: methionine--tRNA ligase, partial [Gammaproteobacteria bacterium]|nr:methionine--tRNA ligase [Gammaproteobacteria bacterium]